MPKIKAIQFFKAVSPLSRALADSTHQLREISFVVARLETDTGVTGEGYLLAFHYSPRAIAGALRDLRPLALGFEVSETGRFIREAEKEQEVLRAGGRSSLGAGGAERGHVGRLGQNPRPAGLAALRRLP